MEDLRSGVAVRFHFLGARFLQPPFRTRISFTDAPDPVFVEVEITRIQVLANDKAYVVVNDETSGW